MTSLAFDFDAPPPPVALQEEKPVEFYDQLDRQAEAAHKSITEKLGFDPRVEGERLAELAERSRALREDLVFPGHAGKPRLAYRHGCYNLNHHMLAFVAQAKCHGFTDPSLTPLGTDAGGRNLFDELGVSRFANELLRGVRSDKPEMTTERWSEAIVMVRTIAAKAREIGGAS